MRIRTLILLLLFGFVAPGAQAAERITIFAAASLKEVMDQVAADFEVDTGIETAVSLAASSVLARQIEAGAPADVYISADRAWMDWLSERGAIAEDTRRTVAGNALVIAGANPLPGGADPATILREGRFAMGDPSHVPAGRYAQAALEHFGLWEMAKDRAVFGENVRVALELARRGEVEVAIVYSSDLQTAEGLSLLYTFPPEGHPPITYQAAATAQAQPAARAFLDFLSSEAGQAIFRERGFTSPVSEAY
ncbi:molybdate ABC transporter substrate-binding protein [Chelativorans sp. SCAU2101]|uniref:Molybdate-binding protein ModA n=1 Tax=Chelativorans petroleitrophicus TaxID=2975484 RepID=A0A9X2XCL1_9HYPH|nr:molybdate ABC transporter substrate-binding protein [Chelativorans petroleitrophicus]MCT8992070.1 molybdate ABC transporter substrate-binding protein [Chelativorans petroleitrophicus]